MVDHLAGTTAPRKGEEKIPLADSSFELAGAKVKVQGAEAKVNWELAAPEALGEQSWRVRSSRLGASFSVAKLQLEWQKIEEKDGVVFDQALSVECENVVLRLKEEAGAGVEGRITAALEDGKLQLALSEYQGHWPAGAWAVESLNCPKVAEISSVVAGRILEALGNANLIDASVKPVLEKALLAAGASASQSLAATLAFPSGIDGLSLLAEGGEIKEISGGFEMRGKLRFRFSRSGRMANEQRHFEAWPEGRVGKTAELYLPEGALNVLLEAGFHSSLLRYDLQSKMLEGFQKLSGSRFRQFFAWPDLLRFRKNTNFLFRFAPVAPPAFRNLRGAGEARLQGALAFPLAIRMYAPLERRWFPYVEFRTSIDANASFRLSEGAVRARLSADPRELRYGFSEEYRDKYRPRSRISTRRLAPALFEAVNENELEMKLPELKIASSAFRVTNWALVPAGRGGALRLEFSSVPPGRKK